MAAWNEIIKNISKDWINYRKHCESTSKSGAKIRIVKQDHDIYNLVRTQWLEAISKNINLNKYTVESSVGLGNISAAPWLTIMDKSITESATEGFYVVYLFSRSAKKLYLSIGIGATQFQEIYGITNECLDKISIARNQFQNLFQKYRPANTIDKIDLLEDDLDFEEPLKGSGRNLVSCYERGTNFSKEYNIDQINDEILAKDLNEYVNLYANIVNDPNAENLDIIAETTIDNAKLAQNKKNVSTDYDIPTYAPRDQSKKKTKKISTVHLSKKKRRTQQSKKIGLAGEEHVYEYEYNKLKSLNKKDLADKIKKHFEVYEYPGWDITSFDKNGNKIYIEVKSTKGTAINLLEITNNEWEAAKAQGQKYYIYLVNNALNEKIKIFEMIQDPSQLVEEEKIEISTSVFELKL